MLDGQHEWFVNPLLSDINYLQYTHEIPNAIVVVIPHKDRNIECSIPDLMTNSPLDKFITEELDLELKKYNPSGFKMIIGHSFSASFSLYSYLNHPNYYAAVIAHSPMDNLEEMINLFEKNNKINKSNISISIGGIAAGKDYYHRKNYDRVKNKFPSFFNSINTYEANYASHNAVPIVATPLFLTKIFNRFSSRYDEIAKVNGEYILIEQPELIPVEVNKIMEASTIGNYFYPPEIAELNGIASRYWNSDYTDYVLKVYELGIKYYPNYFEFYLSLYELNLERDFEKAKYFLDKSEWLVNTIEKDSVFKSEILQEIKAEKSKNGWD